MTYHLLTATLELAIAAYRLLITVFSSGIALLMGILVVMRALYASGTCRRPVSARDRAASISSDAIRNPQAVESPPGIALGTGFRAFWAGVSCKAQRFRFGGPDCRRTDPP